MSAIPAVPSRYGLTMPLLRLLLLCCFSAFAGGCALFGGGEREEEQATVVEGKDPSTRRVRIYISGIDGELKDNASSALELKGMMRKNEASEGLIRRVYGRGMTQTAKALQPFGYYHAQVTGTLTQEGTTFFARYQIELGTPTLVSEVDVTIDGAGKDEKKVLRAVELFEPDPTEILDHRLYEASKLRISDALAERGYFDAEITEKRIAVRLADHSAKIALKFASGPRFQFGPTTFEGAHIQTDVLAGYLPYEAGQGYRQDRLVALQQRLLQADYFSEVEIEPDREKADGLAVPITVRVSPAKRTVYTGGLSFGTDSGFGVQGGLNRRWVNERGHKLSARAEISQRLNSLNAAYSIPLPGKNRQSYNLAFGYLDEETATSVQEVIQVYASRQRETDLGTLSYGLGLISGDFEVGDEPGSSTLLFPEARYLHRVVDDPINPREGYSFSAEVRAAPSIGDAAFAQARVESRYLMAVGERDRLLLRGQVGALWTDDFSRLPPQLRFFAGGDRSLRGFGYQTLGPTNAADKVRGGRYLAIASAEYERHLFDEFGIAGFLDAGNAFDTGDATLAAGVGVGLRWRSPVGLVRLDLAVPVAGEGDGLRLHLLIGPEL